MDTFQFRGKTVDVYTDFNGQQKDWRVQFADADGLINEYEITGYPYPVGQKIQVDYTFRLVRPSNNQVLESYQDSYYEANLAGFYNAILPPSVSYGFFAAYQSINGLIARLPEFEGSKESPASGYRVFRADGTFYQPVTFDVNITQPDYDDQAATPAPNGQISITPVDGVGPFQYSLNGGALQATGTFTDLALGSYTVRVEDSEGTYREEVVDLVNQYGQII